MNKQSSHLVITGLLVSFAGVLLANEVIDSSVSGYVIVEPNNQSPYMNGFPPDHDKLIASDHSWALDPEKALWAFQNLSKLLRVEAISRGSGKVSALPYSGANLLDKTFTSVDGSSVPLREMLKSMHVDGFLAIKDNNIITEAYYNGFRPEKRHIVFSVTKSLVGTLTGILIHEGLLEPSRLIKDYLPELENSGVGDASLRQALDMTISIHWSMVRTDPAAEVNLNSVVGGFHNGAPDIRMNNTLDLLATTRKRSEHGVDYTYNPANTELLGWIITRVMQRNWQEVFADRIWSKLGAEHDALVVVNKQGYGFATAGFNATLRDLGRFGAMIAHNGHYNGKQIAPAEWIQDIRTGDERSRSAWEQSPERELYRDSSFYRNQFRVLDSEEGEFFALGFGGQKIYINVKQNLVGVFLSTEPSREVAAHQVSLMRQIAEM